MAQKKLLFALGIMSTCLLFTGITVLSADNITKAGISQTTAGKKEESDEDKEDMEDRQQNEDTKDKETSQRLNMSVKDKNFALDLARRSRQITMGSIRKKYQELQAMTADRLGEDSVLGREVYGSDGANTGLKVFVSSSMKPSLLKSYVREAKKYGAVLVFNGLPQGSWQVLSQLVQEITEKEQDQGRSKGIRPVRGKEDDEVAIQIDDKAFVKYGVSSVPCFVLAKEENWMSVDEGSSDNGSSEDSTELFDRVVGNIGIKRSLQIFAEEGDLSSEAEKILNSREGH